MRSGDRSRLLGHQSWLVCGRRFVAGCGESMTGFSLSLPWAVAESCMTGQPASALRSTPWGLSGVVSWLSVMANLSSMRVGLTRGGSGCGSGCHGVTAELVEQAGHRPQ